MDFLRDLENNSILLIPNNIKDKVLDYINDNKLLLNIKLMTFRDLKVGLLYDFNNESIYYVMKSENVSYNTAKSYIRDTYYLTKDKYENDKLNNLLKIKNELESNNLLIKDNLFINLIKSKAKLYLYGFSNINIFNKYLLDLCKQYIDVEEIPVNKTEYRHTVYELQSMNDEVKFVAEKIMDLINDGVSLNKIYITNYSDDYYFTISRIFKSYGIPYYLRSETNLYQTAMGLYFINNLIPDKDKMLYKLRMKFDVDNNTYNETIYNKIFNLLNTYTWIDNIIEVKDLLIEELKNVKVPTPHHDNEVSLTNLTDNLFGDDEYVFLIGFNLGSIPKFKKDEDYISDNIKTELQETTEEYNNIQKEVCLNSISSIKNITITYKMVSPFEKYQPSFLIDNKIFTKEEVKYVPSKYNDDINRLEYASLVDKLLKFNEDNEELPSLKKTYDIQYRSYDNKFEDIDNNQLINLMSNENRKVNYSYSSLKQYYQCPFEYYMSSILKLDEYEQQFGAFVGSLFHKVLEECVKENPEDIDTTYDNVIKELRPTLTNKEKFFIEKLRPEMHLVVETIWEQYKHSDNLVIKNESNLKVDIDKKYKTVLKGFIDKILIHDDQIIVLDYKTNDESIDLDLLQFGASLQLPIYLYLLSNDPDYVKYEVLGLYIQNILDLNIKYNPNKDEVTQRKESMTLKGITLKNYDISNFDDTYEKSSIIYNLKLKDGDFANNKNLIDEETKQYILDKTTELIESATTNITDGKFNISPLYIEGKVDACQYCKFKDVCYRKYKDKNIQTIAKEEISDEEI